MLPYLTLRCIGLCPDGGLSSTSISEYVMVCSTVCSVALGISQNVTLFSDLFFNIVSWLHG
jgi:hypothetical protein